MKITKILALLGFMVIMAGSFTAVNGQQAELTGAGATFPYPLYSKMFDEYYNQTKIKVNYQAIGSGGGIRQVLNKTVDFGGTDAFMSDKDIKEAGANILHIPTCLGAVVITYNLPGNPVLRFTPGLIADIYLGKVTRWNDERIKSLNTAISLPDMEIVVAHRSDGSGTTSIFSDYLSKVSAEWKEKVGAGKSLKWPLGIGGKGNPGVAGLIRQIPGSLGYVEFIYALSNNMPVGIVKNKSGNFIEPSIESVKLSADIEIPADTRVSITDTDAKEGYPISGFTWIILYQEQNYGKRTKKQAMETLKLLWWIVEDGQKYAEALHYAPLAPAAAEKAKTLLGSVTYDAEPLLK